MSAEACRDFTVVCTAPLPPLTLSRSHRARPARSAPLEARVTLALPAGAPLPALSHSLGAAPLDHLTLIVALCVPAPRPGAAGALAPLAARVVRVPLRPAPGAATAALPLALPGGALPPGAVLLVVHSSTARVEAAAAWAFARPAAQASLAAGGRALARAVSPAAALGWLEPGAEALFATAPAEGRGALFSSVFALRPGRLALHAEPNLPAALSSAPPPPGASGAAGALDLRVEFSLAARRAAAAGALASGPSPPGARKRGRDEGGAGGGSAGATPGATPGSAPRGLQVGLPPRGATPQQQQQQQQLPLPPPTPPRVAFVFCDAGGALQAARPPAAGARCPFECCALRCRSLTGLRQHLLASHSYYEYFFDDAPAGGGGGAAEVWVRCRPGWHSAAAGGAFLPTLLGDDLRGGEGGGGGAASTAAASGDGGGGGGRHPLLHLLGKSPIWGQFRYACPRALRALRFAEGAAAPVDARDAAAEAAADAAEAAAAALAAARPPAAPAPVAGRRTGRAAAAPPAAPAAAAAPAPARPPARAAPPAPPPRRRPGGVGPHGLPLLAPDGRPQFYHSRSAAPMGAADLADGADSELEADEEAREREGAAALAALRGLAPEQRAFMADWNRHLRGAPLHADAGVPAAAAALAAAHAGRAAADPGWGRCLAAHLATLWGFRLIAPEQAAAALAVARGGGGGGAAVGPGDGA